MSVTTITKKFSVDNILTDPTSIKFSDPDGNYGVKRDDTGATVVDDGTDMNKISKGQYSYTLTDPAYDLTYSYYIEIFYSGETFYFEGTINGTVSPEITGIITLTEIKRWLKLSGTDTNRDDMLQEAINEWSDTIQTRLGRIINTASYADEVHDGGKLAVILKNIPVTAVSSVKEDNSALSSDDYTWSSDGIIRLKTGFRFFGGPGSIEVSYTGGYETIPGDLKKAVKQIVAIEYYLSGHGRKAISKRAESTGQGNVTYEIRPEDQEKIMRRIEQKYGRR